MRANRRSRKGAALMMVMTILALLLVLAVSFTFLMSQQEGTSVASLGGEQTRIITRTGADHAYARLNQRNRLNEFARWYAMQPSDVTDADNPYLDSYDESVIDLLVDLEQQGVFPGLLDSDGNPLFRVEDPRSRVLGMNVQDETGKINLNFATVATIGNLIGASTVQANVTATGGVYEQIVLEDASFLTPYDDIQDSTFAGGYVVIDHQLFSYSYRRGNVLYGCVPNPVYNGADPVNALFEWRGVERMVKAGEYVTTPTAYKIAYWSWMRSLDGSTPALFNTVADVRRIAEMDRWFNPDFSKGPVNFGARMDGWPEGLDPVTTQWLEENATVISPTEHFDGGWSYPHVVVGGDMVPMGESGKDFLLVRYDDQIGVQQDYYVPGDPRRITNVQNNIAQYGGIGVGSKVRLRRLTFPQLSVLGVVFVSGRGQPGRLNVPAQLGTLHIFVKGDVEIGPNEAWVIEVAERASININTANLDTLAAVFHGVGPRGQSAGNMPISRAQAYQIAGEILARTRNAQPFTDLDDLLTLLTRLSKDPNPPINAQQIGIFANQQRYPYAAVNTGTVTAQFRFDSLDVYTVDAFATRYQPGGGAMARDAFREWVQIGSDREQTFSWRTYQQLQSELRIGQGNILQLHPAGTDSDLGGRAIGLLELPYLRYLADERLSRAWRAPPWTGPQAHNVWNLANDQQRPEKFYSNVITAQPTPNSSYEAGNLEAGMFSFWYRPHWDDHAQNHYLFDVAEQEHSNRMSLLWWGDRRGAYRLSGQNSGLVLRVKDRTLQEAYTELRFELDPAHFRPRDWYHMNLNWKGTELSHINLLLDGDAAATAGGVQIRPVVNHTFRQPNGAWLTLTTNLRQDLEDPLLGGQVTFDLPIDNQDVGGFPDRGVIVIGNEAIEYNGNNGFALQNLRRGARGTVAGFHPQGSKLTVFGYRDGLRAYNAGSNNVDVPRFPNLPRTQGLLNSNLGARAFYRVNKQGTNQASYYRPTELGPDAGFPGAGDDTRGGDPYHLPLDSYDGIPERGIVAVIGLAWIDYMPPGQTPGVPAGDAYPNWADDGDANTPPVGNGLYPVPHGVADPTTSPVPNLNSNPPQLRLGALKMEYVAYDGVDAAGLRVLARYDHNFNRKPPNTWWHFLGAYSGLITPAPGNPVDANIVNFLSLGSVVMPLSIDVDAAAGYHSRSVVQIDSEWFFYNGVWNPDSGIDAAGNTPAGADDNLFPSLFYTDFSRLTIFARRCILSDTQTPTPFAPWRGAMGTGVAGHMAAARVLPTLGTTVVTGETDIITLVQGQNANKEQHQIRRHRPLTDLQVDWFAFSAANAAGQLPAPNTGNAGQYICGLDDHVRVDFPPNNGNAWNQNTNLCKFPTGELPVELPTTWTFAGADPRTQDGSSQGAGLNNSGDFDSFEFRMYTKGNFRLVGDMTDTLPANGQDLEVNTLLPPNMGVVRIDNELVAYRGTEVRQVQVTNPSTGQTYTINTFWLLDVTRGILGSTVEAHAGGTPIMNMASLRIGRPSGAGSANTSAIQTILGEETFRPYGFIRVEEENGQTEILGYQRYQELQQPDPNNPGNMIRTGNINCGMYNNPDDPQALFRGAYGTRAMNYSTRALFIDQPVRFPDWFPGYHSTRSRDTGSVSYGPFHTSATEGVPGAESPEISYFQGSAAFRNSVFTQFKWRIQFAPLADMARHSDAIGARLVLRFKERGKPLPEWGSVPTNRSGGLYAFEFDPGLRNTEDLGSTLYQQTEDLTQFPDSPGGIRAERIEWRVYFYFKQNAFSNEDYKTTLQFQGAEVTLNQLTRVIRHEEKR